MSSFTEPPPGQTVPFDKPPGLTTWCDFFLRQQKFLLNVAKLDETQQFLGSNWFNGGNIATGGILLANNYSAFLNVTKTSVNVTDAKPGGGNAAVYIQHYIDDSAANTSNVNSGIRSQVETYQKRASGSYINDVVSGYFGVRNNGTDVGAFGVHIDAYNNGAGASTTMYGMSVEMYNETAIGFTVAYHARSIYSGSYSDNDFAFLASPSPGGSQRFNSVFGAGSTTTGTMLCDYGLDLRQCDAAVAAIIIAPEKYMIWDGVGEAIKTRYEAVGRLAHYVSGVYQFGIENTGRLFIVNNGNTVYGGSAGPSGNFLAINIGGVVYKIGLDTF